MTRAFGQDAQPNVMRRLSCVTRLGPACGAVGFESMQVPTADVTERRETSGPESGSGMRRVGVGALLAASLLTLSGFAAGDPGTAYWGVAYVLVVLVAVVLARWKPVRRLIVFALGAYALALTAATLVAGSRAWLETVEGVRVTLLGANPNVIAAGLVTAFTAWVAVAPRRRWVWWGWPLVALAVVYTGSRAGVGALLVAGTLWVVLEVLPRRRRAFLGIVLFIALVSAAALVWQRGVVEATPNLLAAPSDFTQVAWDARHAERFVVIDDAAPGPFEGARAQRLVATAAEDVSLVVYQSVGRSEVGVPYVASLYLRADVPQRVRLNSNLASLVCEVDDVWRRCVTPAAYGNDRSMNQLKLHTASRGGTFDVYAFGAQYERGKEVSAFTDARPRWIPQAMVRRLDLRRLDLVPAGRVGSLQAGWSIVRERPWFGIGQAKAPDEFLERTRAAGTEVLTYAHNLLVQILAVHGVVGLAGWLVLVVAVLSAVSREGRRRLAPLCFAALVLATWDVTFFALTGFLPMTLAIALWTRTNHEDSRLSATMPSGTT